MQKSIAATVVARVVDVGIQAGVPAAELLEIVGRRREELSIDVRIPIATIFACFEHCMRKVGDSAFPIRVAKTVMLEDYSVLGFALLTSSSFAESFERVVRYGHLISDSGTWQSRTAKSGAIEVLWVRAGARTLGHRAANECAIAEYVGGTRRALGPTFSPTRVFFRHAAPASTREHERYFAAPITWNAPDDGLALDPAIVDMRSPMTNALMNDFFAKALEREPSAEASCGDRTRALLSRELPSGIPSATHVASKLGMSERSLRRALADEGTTFRALVDELRRTVAEDMLRANKSVTEIAFLLGFSETSALSRAFRRWHGTSVRATRRK
jgi:AraC-like DNA-binding protein